MDNLMVGFDIFKNAHLFEMKPESDRVIIETRGIIPSKTDSGIFLFKDMFDQKLYNVGLVDTNGVLRTCSIVNGKPRP